MRESKQPIVRPNARSTFIGSHRRERSDPFPVAPGASVGHRRRHHARRVPLPYDRVGRPERYKRFREESQAAAERRCAVYNSPGSSCRPSSRRSRKPWRGLTP